MQRLTNLVDRLIDHITDRVLARAEQRRTVNVVDTTDIRSFGGKPFRVLDVDDFGQQIKRRGA